MPRSQCNNRLPMANRVRRRQYDEATVWFIREGINRSLEFASITSRSNGQWRREAWHDCLDGSQHANRSYTRPRLAQYRESDDVRHHLLERPQPLPARSVFEASESGDIAARA